VEEFVRKIGKTQVYARFGKKCRVWFDGERAPERPAAKIEEQADQWGDVVGTDGDNARGTVPGAGVVGAGP